MLLATLVFVVTLWGFIEYQQEMMKWVRQNPIINPIILGGAVLIEVFVVFIVSLLVFTDCRKEAAAHKDVYKGRRTKLFPETTVWVDKLGINPKHNKQL